MEYTQEQLAAENKLYLEKNLELVEENRQLREDSQREHRVSMTYCQEIRRLRKDVYELELQLLSKESECKKISQQLISDRQRNMYFPDEMIHARKRDLAASLPRDLVLVDREPSDDVLYAGFASSYRLDTKMGKEKAYCDYKAIVSASEKENQQ